MLRYEAALQSFEATAAKVELNKLACCRFCGADLKHVFIDLGQSPLANSYPRPEDVRRGEPFFPLRVYVCSDCFLVQLEEWESPENIFNDYAYFSSYSTSWLEHARLYVENIISQYKMGPDSTVVEVASNDGYLLQYFLSKGINVLGIEPARNVAEAARAKGIPTRTEFFGEETARRLRDDGVRASLLIGNNVLAHTPVLNDFVRGLKILLDNDGIITMEFPHLMRLMAECQFDTIYHEHFSYFSLLAVERIFQAHGLAIFDVNELPTHGGSLRIFAQHEGVGRHPVSDKVLSLRNREIEEGLTDLGRYIAFEEAASRTKRRLVGFLEDLKKAGKSVVGYGAPAKGNTLLNYCGIGPDLIEYTVDRNPYKQGRLLPGTHIPIFDPERIGVTKPDYILILPWNLRDEIIDQLSFARAWGARFLLPIPELHIVQ